MLRSYGVLLYIVAGSLVAAAFARNVLEALWIGASWTALLGLIGIKVDEKTRERLRSQEASDQLKDFEDAFRKQEERYGMEKNEAEQDSFYRGFAEALSKVARIQNRTVDDLLKGM